MAGETVTETFDYDGSRQVTAYVPPNPPEAIIFCGDGQLIPNWGADIEAAGLPPTMIVGVHRTDNETLRLHEYSPNFDPVRFKTHENFLVKDVVAWTRSRFNQNLPLSRTAVFGVSASGELALALGVRHPDLFGAILSASPGAGYHPPEQMPPTIPRTYLVAGNQEPFFLENALRWANALHDNGIECLMVKRDAGHDDNMWRAEFPMMASWAFRFDEI